MNLYGAVKIISEPEVTQIDMQGIWVLLEDKEYFLPFESYPKFQDATVRQIHHVRLVKEGELSWPDLDLMVQMTLLAEPHHVPQFG